MLRSFTNRTKSLSHASVLQNRAFNNAISRYKNCLISSINSKQNQPHKKGVHNSNQHLLQHNLSSLTINSRIFRSHQLLNYHKKLLKTQKTKKTLNSHLRLRMKLPTLKFRVYFLNLKKKELLHKRLTTHEILRSQKL